ncbi:MAG: hypothetical protein NTZ17_18740 [Phycisphaerae bacterium]|nr:hypothetical protein [Phycisphaerae bacterium]
MIVVQEKHIQNSCQQSEAANPKHETLNPKQIHHPRHQTLSPALSCFELWAFVLHACFEFPEQHRATGIRLRRSCRDSDFEFPPAGWLRGEKGIDSADGSGFDGPP